MTLRPEESQPDCSAQEEDGEGSQVETDGVGPTKEQMIQQLQAEMQAMMSEPWAEPGEIQLPTELGALVEVGAEDEEGDWSANKEEAEQSGVAKKAANKGAGRKRRKKEEDSPGTSTESSDPEYVPPELRRKGAKRAR